MVRHHGSEDNTLGPDDCKALRPYADWPGRKPDAKLLIQGLFQKGRVLAQDGSTTFMVPDQTPTVSAGGAAGSTVRGTWK